MQRLKRTKAGAVHYATKIDLPGNVSGWSREQDQAAFLSAEQVEKIKGFYAGLDGEQRKNLGQFQYEPVSPEEIEAAQSAQQEPESVADLVSQAVESAFAALRGRLTDQFRELDQRLAALESKAATPPSTPPVSPPKHEETPRPIKK